jgi:ABC-type lipoprotein release transport system permease subunit
VTLVLVTAVLVLTSMAAVVSPAGRALRVDPAEALREE